MPALNLPSSNSLLQEAYDRYRAQHGVPPQEEAKPTGDTAIQGLMNKQKWKMLKTMPGKTNNNTWPMMSLLSKGLSPVTKSATLLPSSFEKGADAKSTALKGGLNYAKRNALPLTTAGGAITAGGLSLYNTGRVSNALSDLKDISDTGKGVIDEGKGFMREMRDGFRPLFDVLGHFGRGTAGLVGTPGYDRPQWYHNLMAQIYRLYGREYNPYLHSNNKYMDPDFGTGAAQAKLMQQQAEKMSSFPEQRMTACEAIRIALHGSEQFQKQASTDREPVPDMVLNSHLYLAAEMEKAAGIMETVENAKPFVPFFLAAAEKVRKGYPARPTLTACFGEHTKLADYVLPILDGTAIGLLDKCVQTVADAVMKEAEAKKKVKEAGVTRLLRAAKALQKAPVQNASQIKNIDRQLNISLNKSENRSLAHTVKGYDRWKDMYDRANQASTESLLPRFRLNQQQFADRIHSLPSDSLPTKIDFDRVRQYIRRLTSQRALDHGKHTNPNIHRSGFPSVSDPSLHGVQQSSLYGYTPAKVRISPNPRVSGSVPRPIENTSAVWHEAAGHGLDPVVRSRDDIMRMQHFFQRGLGTDIWNKGVAHTDTVTDQLVPRFEAWADAVGTNATANPADVLSRLQKPIQLSNGKKTSVLNWLTSIFKKRDTGTPNGGQVTVDRQYLKNLYDRYGGNYTKTRVPENYVFNATGNPQRDAATLLKEVGVNHSFNLSDYFRDNRELLQAMLKRLRERREQRILAAQAAAQSAAQPSASSLWQGLARFFGFAR